MIASTDKEKHGREHSLQITTLLGCQPTQNLGIESDWITNKACGNYLLNNTQFIRESFPDV